MITLALFELAARAYFPPSGHSFEEQLRFSPKPRDPSKVVIIGNGESTCQAAPFHTRFTLLDLMVDELKRRAPERTYEKIFLAVGGFNFQKYFDLLRNSLDPLPSLIIVASGHNEFLGKFPGDAVCDERFASLRRLASGSRLYQVVAHRLREQKLAAAPNRNARSLMDLPIACGDEWQATLEEHRNGILALARFCKEHAVPLLIVQGAPNEAGYAPNRSVYHGPANRRDEFLERFSCGDTAMRDNDPAAAREHFEACRAIDPGFAEVSYRLGLIERREGNSYKAKQYFHSAIESDGFPIRILDYQRESFKLAATRYGAFLVDGGAILEARTSDGILDDSTFQDIHHPSAAGYSLIAWAAAQTIFENHLIDFGPFQEVREAAVPAFHRLSQNDWFYAFRDELDWHMIAADLRYDGEERLFYALQYLQMLRQIDGSYVERFLAGSAAESQIQSRLRALEQARPGCHGKKPRNPSTEAYMNLWVIPSRTRFFSFENVPSIDANAVHISGVPSKIVHSFFGVVADGKGTLGEPIQVEGKIHSHGFAFHPSDRWPAEAAFDIEGKFTQFHAFVAINDTGSTRSSAACQVIVDNVSRVSIPPITWNHRMEEVRADVRNGKELRLLCDNGGDGGHSDNIVWIDPELG